MATFGGDEITIQTESDEDQSGQLTNRHYVRLGRAIASPDMESIALGYLNFDDETIKNLHFEHRGNAEAFNRDIIKRWAYQHPGSDQVKDLARLLYKAAEECSYVDPHKIHDVLGIPLTRSEGSQAVEITEEEFLALAERIRPFTEQAMKIEVAPWIEDYVVNMDELYTEVTLEKIHNKVQGEETIVMDDYRQLFTECLAKTLDNHGNESKSADFFSEPTLSFSEPVFLMPENTNSDWEKNSEDDSYNSSDNDSYCCLCVGKSISKNIQKTNKKEKSSTNGNCQYFVSGKGEKSSKNSPQNDVKIGKMGKKWGNALIKTTPAQSDTGEKILAKGDPGMGKTTWSKKVAWDWAKGLFQTFAIVFFVFLKLVKPGTTIENIIIAQNLYMKGLKISDKKLEDIIEVFGNRCLLILDGLDEHALGMNHDVLRIIRGEKLLSCNILVTSRPHTTKQIEKYFPVVLRVEGFTYNKAEQFASKILNDEKSIKAVLNFNPQDFRNDAPIHKCPILLSFLCLLVREDAIDLSTADMHVGEIYFRMVLCLYKKFTIRKGMPFKLSEFIRITMLIGKLAYETLLSGNPLMRRTRVLTEIGPFAFDYGLLIGHEDAHKLIRDITADIFITFPHRSLQEFLGAFYFVLMADEKAKFIRVEFNTAKIPILLTNPLFLRFCMWFLNSDEKDMNLKNASKVHKSLITECASVMNYSHLDTKHIATAYPALDISSALQTNDELRLNFCRDILARCDKVSHITVESLDILEWISVTPTVKAAIIIKCNETGTNFSDMHNAQVCVIWENFCSSNVSSSLEGFHTSSSSRRFQCRNRSRGFLFSCSEFYHLTHIHINNSFTSELSEALEKGKLQCLTHLDLSECIGIEGNIHCLFESLLPQLIHLNLHKTVLTAGDLRALCLACNGKKKTLPKLTSLCLLIPHNMRTTAVSNNLFALPWPRLQEFYLHSHEIHLTTDDCLFLTLNQKRLPSLRSLGIQHDMHAVLLRPLGIVHHVEHLLLYNSILPDEFQATLMNLSRLELLSCVGVNKYLSKFLRQGSLSLNTLVINECSLDSSNLAYLTQARTEGRLAKLKHLDLSQNSITGSDWVNLFSSFSSWNELFTLDIRNNLLGIGDLRHFTTMVQTSGLLGSLQELGIDSYPTVEKNASKSRVWPCLKSLYLSSCETNELRNISDVVDQGCFPALRTICVENFKGYDTVLVHAFNKRNINCHKAKAPFYNPFTRVRCYCQSKPREED